MKDRQKPITSSGLRQLQIKVTSVRLSLLAVLHRRRAPAGGVLHEIVHHVVVQVLVRGGLAEDAREGECGVRAVHALQVRVEPDFSIDFMIFR